jgi:hypothetical protein
VLTISLHQDDWLPPDSGHVTENGAGGRRAQPPAAFDPLARMLLHSEAYRAMTAMLLEASGGRLAMCHEGGYDAAYVPFCGLAILETLSGIRTECADPFLTVLQRGPGEVLGPHQDAAVERAAALVGRIPGP